MPVPNLTSPATLFVFNMNDKAHVSITDPREAEPGELDMSSFTVDYIDMKQFSAFPVYNFLKLTGATVVYLGDDW